MGFNYITALGLVVLAGLLSTSSSNRIAPCGVHAIPQSQLQQLLPGYTTGLLYIEKGLGTAPNVTKRSYRTARGKRDVLLNLGAGLNQTQLAQIACGKDDITHKECADVLLLVLTPAAYSSNNTADTPGGRAFVGPAQSQGPCAACVGFAVTAAAEAAINVYKQQSWGQLGLSEQDLSFCKLYPRVNCDTGASFDDVIPSIDGGKLSKWTSRSCFPYSNSSDEGCGPVEFGNCVRDNALPTGGALSVAYDGSALSTMSKVKEQVMLTGGVIASLAMSTKALERFGQYREGVFTSTEDIPAGAAGAMHAVFCYGWWDNPKSSNDGYWLCKNSWSTAWGLNGSFKIAYGSAYIMQPDYTFAVQCTRSSASARTSLIKQRLKQATLVIDASTPGCVRYSPKYLLRLIKLADDLANLAVSPSNPALRMRKADVLGEVVASNLGAQHKLSAATKGPFRLCGKTAQLMLSLLSPGAPQSPSPPAQPSPSPSPSPLLLQSPSPSPRPLSPSPSPSAPKDCSQAALDPACKRCAKQVAVGQSHSCVLLYDGTVECAGWNMFGQLGRNSTDPLDHPQGQRVTGLDGITISSVAAGGDFTCVLAAPSIGNKVYCFGLGPLGQLGDGRRRNSAVPVAVKGLRQAPPITQLVTDDESGVVVYAGTAAGSSSAMQHWGLSYDIGMQDIGPKGTATDVAETSQVVAVAHSTLDTWYLLSDKTVACMCGTPRGLEPLPGLFDVVRLPPGCSDAGAACAIVRPAVEVPGSLWCWGASQDGILSNSTTPWRVTGLPGDVVEVVVGYNHACALVNSGVGGSGGQVFCWGANYAGQLGQGYTSGTGTQREGSATPLRVKGLSNVLALFGGYDSNCAVTVAQEVLCWGDNTSGMLGVATDGDAGGNIVALPTARLNLCA